MALNSIVHRVPSSKVVPLAFRKVAGGSQRYLHHHCPAVLSSAANRGGNLCSRNIFKQAIAILPSTLHHPYSTKSAEDESLIQILNDKIKSFKGTEAEEIQEDFPFEIVDRDDNLIILTREYQGETIDVEVSMSNIPETEDEEDKDQADLSVKVSKKDVAEILRFRCTAYLDKISIDALYLESNADDNDFFGKLTELDENLEEGFHKYLENRGIKPSNINYAINKDIKKSLLLLENINKFLQK